MSEETLTDCEAPSARSATERPSLTVVLHADDRRLAPSHHDLLDVDEVHLRRAPSRSAVLTRSGRVRQLLLTLPDSWMSAKHAVIRRRGDRWYALDESSKNGTRVDGEIVQEALLCESSIIEVGHTFLLFRAAAPARAIEHELAGNLSRVEPPSQLITLSRLLARTFSLAADVAPSRVPVLILGESGTGKEVLARSVHELSGRRGAFVAINCGAIPSSLVEAELLGFRKGSFSGALQDRIGLVRAAAGGTLFLDEVGDLPLVAQAVLLRVLQEHEVLPVGATQAVSVDFRLVSATHRNLDSMVERGEFRADLLARLSGFRAALPPLAARVEDLGLLIERILRKGGVPLDSVRFSNEVVRAMLTHPWPGNIRELERRVTLAVVLAKGGPIELEHLFGDGNEARQHETARPPSSAGTDATPVPLEPRDAERRDALIALLKEHHGNVTAVARAMGRARVQIQRWIKRYGLDRRSY
jgi:transcriptional regulator with GAF, ATPase, and Fis domain